MELLGKGIGLFVCVVTKKMPCNFSLFIFFLSKREAESAYIEILTSLPWPLRMPRIELRTSYLESKCFIIEQHTWPFKSKYILSWFPYIFYLLFKILNNLELMLWDSWSTHLVHRANLVICPFLIFKIA